MKAYCIINKKTGKITTTEYGAAKNIALNIFPMTVRGEENALGKFDGYEEVAICEIEITKRHTCDCEFYKRKHFSIRKDQSYLIIKKWIDAWSGEAVEVKIQHGVS